MYETNLNETLLDSPKTRNKINNNNNKNNNLWSKDNIAIPMTYICVGFLVSFPNAYIQYYPRILNASDSQLNIVNTIRQLPWSFKLFYGFLADNFPIYNLRFKPYMIIGYIIAGFFNFLLVIYTNPTIFLFTILLLGSMFGILMSDVMGDTLLTLKALEESKESRGKIQTTIYMCRFFSEMVGYWLGAILSNVKIWKFGLTMQQVFMILTFIPFFIAIPTIYYLKEKSVRSYQYLNINESSNTTYDDKLNNKLNHKMPSNDTILPFKIQCFNLYQMLQSKAVYRTLSFIIFYSICNVANASWGNYLKVEYNFSPFQYGSMPAIGSTLTCIGIYIYRKYFMHIPNQWWNVYIYTTLIIVIFMMLNICLVFHINDIFGLSGYWFALGDVAIQSFAYGVQYVPSAIIFVSVCPENQEGAAFSMLTGFQNLSIGLASTLSNILLLIWPVQLEDLEKHNYSGVWKLTLLCGCINIIPLFILPCTLPKGLDDIFALKHIKSKSMGILLIAFYVIAFIWIIIMSLIAILLPCHKLVGGNGCNTI